MGSPLLLAYLILSDEVVQTIEHLLETVEGLLEPRQIAGFSFIKLVTRPRG